MKPFIGIYNKSVLMTYFGVLSAVLGIYLAVTSQLRGALLCIIVCGVCDLFDGVIARRCKRSDAEKEFGVQIDSLADMISFAALPIALFIGAGLTKPYHIAAAGVYVLTAITRLGFFNISAAKSLEKPGSYTGLPVTYAAPVFTAAILVCSRLPQAAGEIVLCGVMLAVAALYILNIRIPKPRGIAYVLFGLLAIGLAAAVIFLGV